MTRLTGLTLASAILLAAGFGATRAEAFMPKVTGLAAATEIVTPAAMCGRSCRNGGRYIPGPPSVCAAEGLNYCGSSRGGGGAAVVIPGTGIGVGVVPPRRSCRTTTVRRPDGTVIRSERCD
jgi:hypothetical protein